MIHMYDNRSEGVVQDTTEIFQQSTLEEKFNITTRTHRLITYNNLQINNIYTIIAEAYFYYIKSSGILSGKKSRKKTMFCLDKDK